MARMLLKSALILMLRREGRTQHFPMPRRSILELAQLLLDMCRCQQKGVRFELCSLGRSREELSASHATATFEGRYRRCSPVGWQHSAMACSQ